MNLSQTLFKQFPGWVELPVSAVRYAAEAGGSRAKWPRRLWGVITAILAGVALAGSSSSVPALSWLPIGVLMLIHWTALALALVWPSGVVLAEQRQGTWELLKVTGRGPQLLIRAKWTASFHRLRPLILLLVGARLVALGLVLADLTAYHGRHLEFYASGPVAVSVVELAALFAAVLLQVPVLLGLNAAVGLLIASAFQRVSAARLLCLGMLVVQLGLSALGDGSLRAIPAMERDPTAPAAASDMLSAVVDGMAGNPDLSQPSLRRILWAWVDVEYSALYGGVVLVIVIAQAFATQAILAVATRIVSKPLLA